MVDSSAATVRWVVGRVASSMTSAPYRLNGTIRSGNSWWIFSHCLHRNLLTMNRLDSPLPSSTFRSLEPMILYSILPQRGQGTFSAHRIKNTFWDAFFYVIMRDDYHIFLEDVSRRATGNSRHYGRRLFLSSDLLMTLYPSIPGQTIPSTFGHYEIALTIMAWIDLKCTMMYWKE